MTLQNTSHPTHSSLLRRTLQANSLFSGFSGIILMADAGPIASFLGLGLAPIVAIIGGILLLHAVILLISTTREPVNPRLAWYAIMGDVAWVIGSMVMLLAGWLPLTTAGWWAVVIVADIVAVFAILQFVGLRRQQ